MMSFDLERACDMAIIEVKNLCKRYPVPGKKGETFAAVDGISLSIDRGEIFGILGPNGAGKTTTLEMLEGLTDIDSGSALIDDIDVQSNPYKVKEIIGVQLQANEYFDNLTISELLVLFGNLYSKNIDPEELLRKVNFRKLYLPHDTLNVHSN